jgi:hypothetical protein
LNRPSEDVYFIETIINNETDNIQTTASGSMEKLKIIDADNADNVKKWNVFWMKSSTPEVLSLNSLLMFSLISVNGWLFPIIFS